MMKILVSLATVSLVGATVNIAAAERHRTYRCRDSCRHALTSVQEHGDMEKGLRGCRCHAERGYRQAQRRSVTGPRLRQTVFSKWFWCPDDRPVHRAGLSQGLAHRVGLQLFILW